MNFCLADADASRRAPPSAQIEALYRREYKVLVRRLLRLLRNLDDAEEIAQLAFVKIVDAGAGFGEIRCGRAYLFRVAHNLAIDHLRRRTLGQRIFNASDPEAAERSGELVHPLTDSETIHVVRDLLLHVDQALATLPPKCRTAFLMNKAEDKTYPEIAATMGLSISMIEKYMSRALNHVRGQLPADALAV